MATLYCHLANFHLPYMKMLQDCGCEVHAAAYPDWHIQRVENKLVRCRRVQFSRSILNPKNLAAVLTMRRILKEEDYDLIHVHSPIAAFITRLALLGIKRGALIYTVHGFHFYKGASWLKWLLYFPAEWIASFWTDAMIVINEEDYKTARLLRGLPVNRIHLVPGVGVSLDQYGSTMDGPGKAELRRELDIPAGVKVAICVGEFNRNKNQEMILKAWPRILEKVPSAYLLLAGEGSREKFLRKTSVKLKLEQFIRFLGFRTDIPDLLQLADVVLLTSFREGLPRAVLEAMAAGRPVVATDTRGTRDLVVDGVTGFLVPCGDSAAAAEKIIELFDDTGLAETMGTQAALRSQSFSFGKVAAQMADIYKYYLNGSRSFLQEETGEKAGLGHKK